MLHFFVLQHIIVYLVEPFISYYENYSVTYVIKQEQNEKERLFKWNISVNLVPCSYLRPLWQYICKYVGIL